MSLAALGVRLELPPGWDGEIYPAAEAAADVAGAAGPRAVVHAATFPLPADRGDFGSGAVAGMQPGDVLVIVFEYGRASAAEPLFAAEGVPALAEDDFDDRTMPRRRTGLVGAQRFFRAQGRAFCLHVVLGARRPDPTLVAVANAVAGGLRID